MWGWSFSPRLAGRPLHKLPSFFFLPSHYLHFLALLQCSARSSELEEARLDGIEWHRTRSLLVFFLCKDTLHFVQRELSLSNLSKSSLNSTMPLWLLKVKLRAFLTTEEMTCFSVQTPTTLQKRQIYFWS